MHVLQRRRRPGLEELQYLQSPFETADGAGFRHGLFRAAATRRTRSFRQAERTMTFRRAELHRFSLVRDRHCAEACTWTWPATRKPRAPAERQVTGGPPLQWAKFATSSSSCATSCAG